MTIRIGLLGCGKIARLHIAGFKAAPDLCKVVVVCDEYSEELARTTAHDLNAEWTTSWQAVVERNDVDAISICLPPYQHAPIALAAAAGKHVLVEKPMAMNLAEARQMVAAAQAAGTVLMVGQNQRFQPEHVKIKELLDRNAIGRIVAIRFDCNQFVKYMYPPDSWIFDKEKSGGGMIAQTAVHKIDLMRHFFGEVVEDFVFNADDLIGSPQAPQVVHTNNLLLSQIPLHTGWNWISFNLGLPNPAPSVACAPCLDPLPLASLSLFPRRKGSASLNRSGFRHSARVYL